MHGIVKTVGTSVFGAFAIPVAGISGLGAIGSLLAWIFSAQNRTGGMFLFFVAASTTCLLAIRFLAALHRNAQNLVDDINRQSNLSFNPSNLLGYPATVFLVFDKSNRKLAVCNSSTGDFQIHDLAYLLAWRYEWKNKQSMELSGIGRQIDGTNMHAPSFERVGRRESFALVLELANENNPVLKFPMSERAAKEWCAKLNAIVNG